MKVIGLTGVARAGKDTVAGIVVEELNESGLDAKREGFADKLKISAALALGWSGDDLVALMDDLKVGGYVESGLDDTVTGGARISGREFLQRYGTEAHRDLFGDGFWVDALLPLRRWSVGYGGIAAEPDRDDCDVLVVPDVRFDNEAQRILKYEGVIWRVSRPGIGAANGHASESGIADELVTRTIRNDGGLGYLRDVVRIALFEAGLL